MPYGCSRATFSDLNTGALRQLESIVHPAVRAAIRSELETWRSHDGIVVVDAVRLLQSDLLRSEYRCFEAAGKYRSSRRSRCDSVGARDLAQSRRHRCRRCRTAAPERPSPI